MIAFSVIFLHKCTIQKEKKWENNTENYVILVYSLIMKESYYKMESCIKQFGWPLIYFQ